MDQIYDCQPDEESTSLDMNWTDSSKENCFFKGMYLECAKGDRWFVEVVRHKTVKSTFE